METKVAAYDADIVGHNLVDLAHTLSDEHFLLVGHCALVVPLRHLIIEVIEVDVLQRVLSGSIGIDDSLDEGVGSQSVATMKASTGAFTQCIEPLDARLSVEVYLDASAHIVCCRTDRDIVGGDVDAHREALLVDVGEVTTRLCRILVSDIEADVIDAVNLHLLVDGTSHNITWCQREPLVVFLHERLAIGQFQDATIAAHRLSDEVGGMRLAGMMEDSGMKLHELHILHRSLGTIDHSDAVACSNDRVRGGEIDGSTSACTHDGDFREISVHTSPPFVPRGGHIRPGYRSPLGGSRGG